jgi:putative FmdB family regulatory protein
MPVYAFRCDACEYEFDRILPLSRYEDPQTCPECGEGPAARRFTPPNFILKGDGWDGKNHTISREMAKKNERLDARQKSQPTPGMRLAPNVDGQRVDSWSDAAKLAKDKGKDTTAYEHRAAQEKKP